MQAASRRIEFWLEWWLSGPSRALCPNSSKKCSTRHATTVVPGQAPTAVRNEQRYFTSYTSVHLTSASFLANVSSRSCSLYVVVRPSVVCNVRAPYTQPVEIFGNVSTPLGTLVTHWHAQKISRRLS